MEKMKAGLLALSMFATAAQAQVTDPAPYCGAGYDDHGMNVPHYISKVSIGTLSNSSGNTQYPGYHYVFYNNLAPTPLAKGTTCPLSVYYDAGATVHFVAVFIDFNKNNSFSDPGEMVLNKRFPEGVNPVTANVAIPATAQTGTTRMRVMVFEDDQFSAQAQEAVPCTADASGTFDWGETEDYILNITAGATGLPSFTDKESMLLYPNPAKDHIRIADDCLGYPLMITDIRGRIVSAYPAAPGKADISFLEAGMYFVRSTNGDKTSLQKLLIRK